ncbi:haloacid dehalogenase type II [Methylobacterium gnaphalii]|uniref:(S)-2-haloacid dehalogenase n=1 Tax=Methylobacterium gnaphalii TaxID=1010610 RepID=A0A512JHV6_9HYPH|nr:haloacid dehalogenase type II [Methylobacterium gnaphalii]GEP09539.1 haloacid dehalogenase [Methylobacterium gnaphalii]GJD69942.1 (S)-2-haloacid dehalogenase 4A [Methylobacterium gnaphalii]GLS48163.1 haloacid dehalogenase [Methylobacterium gnaphalii]
MPDAISFTGKSCVVFDAYGTLLDVHSAVQRHADGIGPEASSLSALWRVKQLEYSWVLSLIGGYQTFWSLTEQALDYALARHPTVDPALRQPLLDAYRALDAYPEVPDVLLRLREAGLRTAILSNGNQDMLDIAVASASLADRLDAVLSVDAVQVFKTSPKAYQLVLDRFSGTPAEVVFCSSNRWDIAGAAAFGFTAVWVNRQGLPDEYPDLAPTAVVKDLSALL